MGLHAEERRRYLPGDEIESPARLVTNHAATLRATREEIWPWLLQVGWHRGGWYTYRWVDRLLFPANQPAAESILPEYQDLKVGDRIPDGPPESGCFFEVEMLEPHKLMVLHSWTHLPPQVRGARLDWTWTFHLEQTGERESRFLFRVRGKPRADLDAAPLPPRDRPGRLRDGPQHVPRPQPAPGARPRPFSAVAPAYRC